MHDGDAGNDPKAARAVAQAEFERLPLLTVARFAADVCDQVKQQEADFAWFLGAGCSASSGILPASWLVRGWLDELHRRHRIDHPDARRDDWVRSTFGALAVDDPGAVYSAVFARLYHSRFEQQSAIETLCEDRRPGFGYLTMAQLITHAEYGRRWNTVLTTNFDELVADAIYAIGTSKARPQVIGHESLAAHIRLRASRPTIIKVHGDRMVGARNTVDQIRRTPTASATTPNFCSRAATARRASMFSGGPSRRCPSPRQRRSSSNCTTTSTPTRRRPRARFGT